MVYVTTYRFTCGAVHRHADHVLYVTIYRFTCGAVHRHADHVLRLERGSVELVADVLPLVPHLLVGVEHLLEIVAEARDEQALPVAVYAVTVLGGKTEQVSLGKPCV